MKTTFVILTALLLAPLINSASAVKQQPAVRSGPMDLATPTMTDGVPGPGRRVRQVASEYQGTEVYHAIYLPLDWTPAGKLPVIVEYTGNKCAPANSTGEAKHANLGYGLSGGWGFIWVTMPYVEKGLKANALNWWGDKEATVEYCKVNVSRSQNASRLRDDYLKDHLDLAHFTFLDVPTANLFNLPEGKVIHPHTDLWLHKESEYRKQARSWIETVVAPIDPKTPSVNPR